MISCSHWGQFEEIVCKHPRATGNGSQGMNGIGSMSWHCPDCGKSERHTFGPVNMAQAVANAYYQHNRFGTLD